MNNKQTIFCISNNTDLLEISENLNTSINIDLNISYIELIKKIMENINKKNLQIITDNSVKGELFSIISKILNKNTKYSIWFEEIKTNSIPSEILELISVYFSSSLITRSKQMKHQLNIKYKKRVFVIYPWVKEKKFSHKIKKYNYNLFTKSNFKLPENWKTVNKVEDADISIIKLKDKLLNFQLPKIIFNSIEERIPTIIIYHKPKTVNKIFKYVKNIHVIGNEKELDFNYLEYLVNQSYKFKIPKKLRFKYNLSNFKKYFK